MDINEEDSIVDNEAHQNAPVDDDGDFAVPVLNPNLFLDHVGEVALTLDSDGLSWKSLEAFDNDGSTCLGIKLGPEIPTVIKFSDFYAVEFINYGSVSKSNLPNAGKVLLGRESHDIEMYRFVVHGFQKSETQPNLWVLVEYTFGHKDLPTCEMWVNKLNDSLNIEVGRPKNLLVFVHPMSGKGNGRRTWETVAPIFARAQIKTKVIVTERAGQAFEVMASTTNKELSSYDGVVTVGGDGFFNEILNGFLSSRHKAPYPPAPSDFVHSVENNGFSVHDPDQTVAEASDKNEDQCPLLPSPQLNHQGLSNLVEDPEFPLPNEWFRFGIIPAGSTDAIVIWYGFYGDVITESEKYRWIGPKRYDYAGTKVFLRHRSYEAEIAYLEVESGTTKTTPERSRRFSRVHKLWSPSKSDRVICRTNCNICNKKSVCPTPYSRPGETKWLRSRGRFLSIGAAIMSNRNEKAPDGLVVDAHLSDGFLHLILIKDCPRALYLWHLTELARKGGDPLNFEFVEHHKTPAFTFTSSGTESVWNLDGELFPAHQLSAQVFQGLISLFANGPEV